MTKTLSGLFTSTGHSLAISLHSYILSLSLSSSLMFCSGSKNLRERSDGPSLSLPMKHFQAACLFRV